MVLGRDRVQGREPVGRSCLVQVQDRTRAIPWANPRKTYTDRGRDQPM